jgi:predicted CopG family antitoxin
LSKVIKVDEEIYGSLDKLRGKGDTFGTVIEDLLKTREITLGAIQLLEGPVKYRQWLEERYREQNNIEEGV